MTSFASLMALAANNTRESQLAVEHAMQERRRKEALQKKQQEEKEAKERELEKQRRLKFFEEERKRKERAEKLEAERKAKEAALQRREEEQRNSLLYGPKKAAKMSLSSSNGGSPKYPSRDGAARKRRADESDNDGPQGIVLTREEIRERKLQAEMRRQFQGSKRSSHTGHYTRVGKTLPGGAVNIVLNPDTASPTPPPPEPPANGKPIKERLLQGPNALLRLGTEKRDQRSVDEALTDIRIKMGKATPKVLSGEQARNFQDWFSTSKKASPPPPASATTSNAESSTRKATTPVPSVSKSDSSMQKKASSISRPASTKPIPSTSKLSTATSRASSSEKHVSSSSSQSKYSKISKSSASASTQRPTAHKAQSRPKRPRSPSLSDSPPPPKRRPKERYEDNSDKSDIRNTIWEMFGKNRDEYATRDVFSDDEDMEADADDLEREEAISMRVAKREDMAALEEERRHEEEKRRRKRERERALARDH
ncbi:unnamed protein product [Cyclocybe aegerita]|uniref:SPT2 chromatin protein n=1 Tax=Cyclocybe aegerita TaxID=1973307 RepID=A0A8S0WNQ4_CYCAE|nr:unnamed protein product [Cyclocybe aegerita]